MAFRVNPSGLDGRVEAFVMGRVVVFILIVPFMEVLHWKSIQIRKGIRVVFGLGSVVSVLTFTN